MVAKRSTRPALPLGAWVYVVWHDAADEKQTWMTAEEIDEELVAVVSVGCLVRQTKRYYTLAGDMNHQSAAPLTPVYGRVTRIPTGMVAEVIVLRDAEGTKAS